MIILRQKTYTRAEREALKELLLKTRGFQRLPNGAKMTARDVNRFNYLATSAQLWAKGYKPELIKLEGPIKNAKTFLEHADLGKSSKELEHVVNKYSNKRALARWQRLMRRKTESERIEKMVPLKKMRKVENYVSADANDCAKYASSKINIKRGEGNLMSSLAKDAKKYNIPIIHSKDGAGYSYHQPLKKTRKSGIDSKVIESAFISDSKKGFSKKQAKKLKSLAINNNIEGAIVLGRSAGPGTLAHELGHHITEYFIPSGRNLSLIEDVTDKSARTMARRLKRGDLDIVRLNRKSKKIGNALNNVANENSATSYGLARLKKHGATPEQLEEFRKMLGSNGALGSYININRADVFKTYGSKI